MPTYKVISIVEGQPTFEKPLLEIFKGMNVGYAIKTMTPAEYITDRQRRWYKGVCLRDLARNDENGETVGWWDIEVKRLCKGLDYLNKEIFFYENESGEKIPQGRLTTVGVGVKNMTLFIEEILSVAIVKGWPIGAPDPDLRRF